MFTHTTQLRKKIQELEEYLTYQFHDKEVLIQALVHPSGSAIKSTPYQRLELLGDAVLSLIITTLLYEGGSTFNVGKLSKMKACLVSKEACCIYATNLGLSEWIVVGYTVHANWDFYKETMLSDTMESLLGALFIDGGLCVAKKVFSKCGMDHFNAVYSGNLKIESGQESLQKWLQKTHRFDSLEYSISSYDTSKGYSEFEAVILLDGKEISRGVGHSKKKAKEVAAKIAINSMMNNTLCD